MATFVLVHGAWSGGWCYFKVAERLRALGHLVFTPTLTGQGERSHLTGTPINLTLHTSMCSMYSTTNTWMTSCWLATPTAAW